MEKKAKKVYGEDVSLGLNSWYGHVLAVTTNGFTPTPLQLHTKYTQ